MSGELDAEIERRANAGPAHCTLRYASVNVRKSPAQGQNNANDFAAWQKWWAWGNRIWSTIAA